MSTDTTPSSSVPGEDTRRQWHRLFGIALTELFEGAPWRVELEQELAVRSQLLDVAIIEAVGEGAERRFPPDLPDGLDNLRAHNLLTYKSHHEALNAWALDELIGHYVNYRKLHLNSEGKRHPSSAFGLYAVATRCPRRLNATHPLQPTAWDGVYDQPWGGQVVRLIVLNEIAPHPRNVAWELFASERDRLRQGLIHYRARYPNPTPGGHWALLEYLHLIYQREVSNMAYTMEEFLREAEEIAIDRVMKRDPDAILKRFDADEVLKRFDPDEVLKHFDAEERLKGLEAEDVLKRLDPATIEAWLAKQHRDH
ncbi:hypothetical protein [Allochromatium palmeri]|uniref:DUF4351 domain-containing protein n=1 Tax=Allochromatium palmeri TaxID=231048 RepID=A0A6N8EBX4_9GAMM|nr:hypothetical protein [Allochromatium palmeri]MTW20858.1 hypothetical protein [Allochromatium palmeri]